MRCPVANCGEPWDLDTLHERIAELSPADSEKTGKEYEAVFNAAYKEFMERGCEYLGTTHNKPGSEEVGTYGLTASETQKALFELFGDDVDGIEAMMEDEGF